MSVRERSALFRLNEAGQVGEIRRHAMAMAAAAGLDETQTGKLGIIVTEAAGNIVKHAKSGEIVLRQLPGGVEMLALDNGSGIADISRSMEDGHSTAGSPGTGLGAMSRLADCFDIYSQPGKGTVVLAQCRMKNTTATTGWQIGAICLPLAGETECGDSWSSADNAGSLRMVLADGLGHGEMAAQASAAAMAVFTQHPDLAPLEIVQRAHQALKATRGAALAVLSIDAERRIMHFAGVGNIAGSIIDGGKSRGLASYNGTVGHQLYKCQEMHYPWPEQGLLLLHSDGLNTRWKLDDYPGLRQHHPALIAAVLYRDYRRDRDDVTVVVVKGG